MKYDSTLNALEKLEIYLIGIFYFNIIKIGACQNLVYYQLKTYTIA